MKVAVLYEGKKGYTIATAINLAHEFEKKGHECLVIPACAASERVLEDADLICLGCASEGLSLFDRTWRRLISRLGNLLGKRTVIFCTYDTFSPSSVLQNMANALSHKGAQVLGEFGFRGSRIGPDFEPFANSLDYLPAA